MSEAEAEREAIQGELRALVARQKQVTFTDPTADSSTDEGALGVMLARYFGWSAEPLIDIAAEALEDANFHDEAAAVRAL